MEGATVRGGKSAMLWCVVVLWYGEACGAVRCYSAMWCGATYVASLFMRRHGAARCGAKLPCHIEVGLGCFAYSSVKSCSVVGSSVRPEGWFKYTFFFVFHFSAETIMLRNTEGGSVGSGSGGGGHRTVTQPSLGEGYGAVRCSEARCHAMPWCVILIGERGWHMRCKGVQHTYRTKRLTYTLCTRPTRPNPNHEPNRPNQPHDY